MVVGGRSWPALFFPSGSAMPLTAEALVAEIRGRVAALGFELVDLRVGGAGARVRLQVRVDRLDAVTGCGITIDECATVSRALEAWLDATESLGRRYVLEVSSPGIERPVRWPEHWERFTGRDVHVRIPGRGRVRATINGLSPARDVVALRLRGTDEVVTVPLADARDATLAVDWDASGLRPRSDPSSGDHGTP
jgi:ribosome maturation factor RimP